MFLSYHDKIDFFKNEPRLMSKNFPFKSYSTADNKNEKNQLCERKEQRTQVPYKRSFQEKMLNV